MDLDERIEQYRERFKSMTQKQRALAEDEIYRDAKECGRFPKGTMYRRWFRQNVLDQDLSGFEIRHGLLMQGEKIDPLWEYAERKKLGATRLKRVMMEAQRISRLRTIPLEEALAKMMQDHKPSAKKKRKATGRRKKRKVFHYPVDSIENGNSKAFWVMIQDQAKKFISTRMRDRTQKERDDIFSLFESDVKSAVDTLRARLSSLKKETRRDSIRFVNQNMRSACERLGVDPPKDGVFDFEKAKKQFRRLVQEMHPDRNSDPAVVRQYDDVVKSFGIVQQWQEIESKEKKV